MKAKKFCIIALVLAIVLFIAPISESKAEEEPEVKTSGDYDYIVLDDGTACIKTYNGEDEEVIIPEKLDEIRVTCIGYKAFSSCKNITEIKISDGVQSIEEGAFSLCENLTEITIPDSVKSIGDSAFSWCKNLTEITIPDSVENIGVNPFKSCSHLLNINISANHPTLEFVDNALIYKPEKKIVSYIFASNESKYEIPDGIESIGENAFSDCTNLKKIKIPDSVKSIGDSAFSWCVNLKEIIIPDSVEKIGENPFDSCNKLLNINISADHPTLAFIDNALFYKPEKKIVSYLRASKESKYEILDGIKIIGDSAFKDCYNLTEIKIPDGVQSIGDSAFSFCENLREIKIPEGVKSIGDRTFYYCYNLIEIKIPEGVKSIGNGAFEGCGDLTEITIPDSVKKIGENPFDSCNKLLNINISADHSTLAFIDNALFYKPEKKIVSYLSASKESKYEIPDGIESIGKDAFYGCKNLTEIKIPEGVQSIGYSAFSLCENLTEIKISEGVKSIGDWAFSWCKNMKKINIPASVNYIGKYAFEDCNNLTATVARDSYAEKYCQENNIKYLYEDSLDWLKN